MDEEEEEEEERKPDQMSNRGGGAMRVWKGEKKKRRGWDETRRTKRKGREVDKTDNVHERDKARRVYAR